MSLCYFSAGLLRLRLSPPVFATVMSGNLNKPEYQTQQLGFVGASELRKREGKYSAHRHEDGFRLWWHREHLSLHLICKDKVFHLLEKKTAMTAPPPALMVCINVRQ